MNKQFSTQFNHHRYKRSPRTQAKDSSLLLPSGSSKLFHTKSVKKLKTHHKPSQIPKGTHYWFPAAQSSMVQLQNPSFINDEIDDFMERLKNTSGPINGSRIKTVYFQDTIAQNLDNPHRNQNLIHQEESNRYQNQGFCRISYQISKKLANTSAYKKYKQQKKHIKNGGESPQSPNNLHSKIEQDKKLDTLQKIDDEHENKEDQFEFQAREEIVEYRGRKQKLVQKDQQLLQKADSG